MVILAIETSCDDTAIAIIETKGQKNPRFRILSNIISSQVKLHAKYGGVYPSLAKREHQKNLPIVLKKALRQAQGKQIDAIAVTVGPGLEPCLWTGINFAKILSQKMKLPIIPVNHIEAHILANLLSQISEISNTESREGGTKAKKSRRTHSCSSPPFAMLGWPKFSSPTKFLISKKIKFPAVCLVVSGGHTQLILMKDFGQYKILGETRDDAAGECFDKTARILGLGYPGGPAIAKTATQLSARKVIPSRICLPRPMMYQKNYDFSFSGLKTAVLYDFKGRPPKIKRSREYIQQMAAEIQQAIIDVLIHKTIKAAKDYRAKTIILGGGVAANEKLRKQFEVQCSNLKVNFLVPLKNLCTDNAAMTAVAGYSNWSKGATKIRGDIEANANLRLE